MADAVLGAKKGQQAPQRYCNADRILKRVAGKGGVHLCGGCMDARGIAASETMDNPERSALDAFAEATAPAAKGPVC